MLTFSESNNCIKSAKKMGLIVKEKYRAAEKSLAPPGRKQATATEDFEFHISYLKS
jgi:hypothetical protein